MLMTTAGLGSQGQSIAEEPTKRSHRRCAAKVAHHAGGSACRHTATALETVDETDALPALTADLLVGLFPREVQNPGTSQTCLVQGAGSNDTAIAGAV